MTGINAAGLPANSPVGDNHKLWTKDFRDEH